MRSLRPGSTILIALALLLGACEDSSVVAPDLPVEVEVVPGGTVLLGIGDTTSLQVTVRNAATDAAVRFRSSNQAIATVSPVGLVTGVSRGIATVTVSSAQDTTAQQAVGVRVVDETTLPPTSAAPAIGIEALADSANRLISPDSVRGTVFARVSVERGPATRAEVLLDGIVGCALDFPTTSAASAAALSLSSVPVTLACQINTARFDTTTGAPTFYNGPAVLSARLLGPGGATLASAGAVQLSLANKDVVAATIRGERQAAVGAGPTWLGGDLTLTALPVSYDAAAAISRVSFTYARPGAPALVVVDSLAPYVATFREEAGLNGIVDDSLRVTVATVTASGRSGPGTVAGPARYDARPPVPGTLTAREWIGRATTLTSLYDAAGQQDVGVGGIFTRFFAGSPALEPAALVVSGKQVAVGSDLAESAARGYELAALVCDALENCTLVPGFTFGVDLTPPQIAGATIEARSVNPADDLALGLDDGLSGFGARPILAVVTVLDGDPSTPVCGPVVAGTDLPGRAAGSSCAADTVTSVLPVPRAKAGYYTYYVTPVDRAGNVGATDTIPVLVDVAPPTVANVALPASLAGGDPLVLAAEARDNLDLAALSLRLAFPGAGGGRLALPFTSEAVGTPFDSRLDTVATAQLRMPHFVRTLTYASGTSGRTTVLVDSAQVWAIDAAGQMARAGEPIPSAVLAGVGTADPFKAISGVAASVSTAQFCTSDCLASDPNVIAFTLRLTSQSSSGAPFARVYFYRQSSDGMVFLLGSVAEVTSTTDTGSERVIAYSFPYRPAAGLEGEFNLFAVGVTSTGSALKSGDVPITLFSR